jgi:PAS domain S-box-containing protein
LTSDGYSREALLEKFKYTTTNEVNEFEWLFLDSMNNQFLTKITIRRTACKCGVCNVILASIKYIAKVKGYESERLLLHTFMNSIADPIWLRSLDGTFLLCNDAYAKMHDLSIADIIGKNTNDIMNSDAKDGLFRIDKTALTEDRSVVYEDWVELKKTGNKVLLETIKVPFFNAENEIVGILHIARDITEKDKMQKALRHSQEQLKAINDSLKKAVKQKIEELRKKDSIMFQQSRFAAMGEMLSMIAHQWRQPLNAVSTASINLKMYSDMGLLNEHLIEEQCTFIEDQAQKMSKTINDFMDFFRPNKEMELFFVNESVLEVEKMIESQLKNRNIKLVKNIDKEAKVLGTRNELEHVLLNIVANARDALEEKKPFFKQIVISVEQSEKNVTINISDNAGGVPKEIMNRVFDPYFSTKSKSKGAGIGLYMSKTIISRNFRGDINVSNDDDGAVFQIKIPKKSQK